jgi:hypothetical protein
MKGQVETTIPQRQYENIKTTYYFETEEEHDAAIKLAISDCIQLNGAVTSKLNRDTTAKVEANAQTVTADTVLEVTARKVIDGVDWRLRKGKWEKYVNGQWTPAEEV